MAHLILLEDREAPMTRSIDAQLSVVGLYIGFNWGLGLARVQGQGQGQGQGTFRVQGLGFSVQGVQGLGIRDFKVLGLFKVQGSSIECAHTLLEAPAPLRIKCMRIYVCFLGHQRYIDDREREREIEIPKNMFKYTLKYMHECIVGHACTLIIYIL